MIGIAVIFTCFNRINMTKRCMDALRAQQKLYRDEIVFDVYITDDGSTDGTVKMIKDYAKDFCIKILTGRDLFWNKGMHKAMQEAVKKKHDYYLMINDDVDFDYDFLNTMLESYMNAKEPCGISGATRNTESYFTTYGGKIFGSKKFLDPDGTIQECNLANWNCFLIGQEIINRIGIIDPNYIHGYGDYDYSMLMQRNGYKIYLAKKYVGKCNRNSINGTFEDTKLSRKQRLKLFFSPKGMSLKSGLRYMYKNMDFLGVGGMFKFIGAYCLNLIVILIG